jgi:hypothetical protein
MCFGMTIARAAGDLVGYWPFDDTGSQIVDTSGNANDGTINGGVTSSTDVPPVSCFNDPRSLAFDGVGGSYINVPDAASMDPASQITIAFWVKPVAINNSNYQHIIFKNMGGGLTSYGVWYDPTGHIYAETNDTIVRGIASTGVVAPGAWHYVVVDYNGVDQKLYIDGALNNTNHVPGITIGYGGFPLKIGDGDFNLPLQGNIDDLRIYDRGLTDQEVADLAAGGCGPNVSPTPVPSPAPSTPTATQTTTVKAPNTGLNPKHETFAVMSAFAGGLLSILAVASSIYVLRRKS